MPTKLLWKLPGVILAAFSLVMLMTPAFDIQFKPWFVEFLKELEDWEVTLFFQFITPQVEAVIDYLNATFDWHLKLADWWHHAFVLLWLMHGSMARNLGRGQGWGYFLFIMIWGGLTAFVAGAATGTAQLNGDAMLMWPFAGYFGFVAGYFAWEAVLGEDSWWWPLGMTVCATSFAYLGYAGTTPWTSTLTSLFGPDVPSPGLLDLTCAVGLIGLNSILQSLYFAARGDAPIDNQTTSMGLDIIGAYGFAAAFAIAGQYLM